MRSKDRERLRAAAFLLGETSANGEPLPEDITARHDWRTFLLAKDMYSNYLGPTWVPFGLWQTSDSDRGLPGRCAKKLIHSTGAEQLWKAIEARFDAPNIVATALPFELAMALRKWRVTSKRIPKKHREHCLEMKARAESLAREIDRIEELDFFSTGERFDFMRLYNDEEKERMYKAVRVHNLSMRNTGALEVEARKLGYKVGSLRGGSDAPVSWDEYITPEDSTKPESPLNLSIAGREAGETWEWLTGDDEEWPGIVPKPADMLRRLGSYFAIESKRPELSRPAMANAERNFVTQWLCRYFRDSFRPRPSPKIIATTVSFFYRQGITENEVSQMIAKLPAREWFPDDSESSA